MAIQDDDLFSEGAKKVKQLIRDKQIKSTDIVNALGISKETVTKWVQDAAPLNTHNLIELAKLIGVTERWMVEGKENFKPQKMKANVDEVSLKQASPDQLISELKARYAALNLKAEIKISVEPLEGGFVTKK